MTDPIFPAAGERPVTFNDLNDAIDQAAAKVFDAGRTEVANGLELLTAELIKVATKHHTAEAHKINVGDRVKIQGVWMTVTNVNRTSARYHVYTGDGEVLPQDFEDVYTADEFARNSALVQFEGRDAAHVVYESLGNEWAGGWIDHSFDWTNTRFLTPEAAAALGTFEPVPDRPTESKVYGWMQDETFKALSKKVGTIVGTSQRTEYDDRIVVHGPDGDHVHYKAEPTTDARPWTEWDLITAGDGVTRHRWTDVHGHRYWHEAHTAERLTDDEIAAMGEVRRAVVATLPEHALWSIRERVKFQGAQSSIEEAAELLAAALQAEEEGR